MGEVARDNNNKKTEQMSMQGITEGLQYIISWNTYPVLITFSSQSLMYVT